MAANAPAPTGDTVTSGSAAASNVDPVQTAPAPPASSRAPIRPQSSEPADERIVREWSELWRQRGGELAAGELVDVVASDAGLTVAEGAATGSLTSVAYSSAFPFDEVVPSWQVDTAGGSEIKVEVRALLQPGWTGWYTLGFWGDNARSQRGQDDANARVAIDTLKLRQPATAVQYRVTLTRGAEVAPLLRGFAVSLADSGRVAANVSPVRPEMARDLDVPRRSQLQDGGSLANEICSPTSLGMVLGFWDVVQPTQQVVRGVYDRGAGIYGNWPFNTAYAASLGVTAFVDRFNSITDLEDEIAAGRPVIISVNYREGELAGAYLRRTGGHILVVRGITSDGSVIVNDPFSPDAGSVRRVYRRDQVAKVWLNNAGGVVYRLSRE
ncbi:MAG: peptidase C39 family protein [Chloroflexi bacterium]|nr:peptidase C39 family protein [Chloroflexota bacterium]